MVKKRARYKISTKEFKLEAVRLMMESDKPLSEIAAELGIRRNQLYKWKNQQPHPAVFSEKDMPCSTLSKEA